MDLVDAHLEQIALSAAAIADLPFPAPKRFTNALLHQHDITTLIRDTETHERALFSVPPPPSVLQDTSANLRRKTVYDLHGGDNVLSGGAVPSIIRAPRRNTAVAAVLGGALVEQIRQGGGGGPGTGLGYGARGPRERGEVDVEILLCGAEKLCAVYPIVGSADQIASFRSRYAQLTSSIAHHEARVAKQETRLDRKNRPKHLDDDEEDREDEVSSSLLSGEDEHPCDITEDDLEREQAEIQELDKKKRALEERVAGMERDLGGLQR